MPVESVVDVGDTTPFLPPKEKPSVEEEFEEMDRKHKNRALCCSLLSLLVSLPALIGA